MKILYIILKVLLYTAVALLVSCLILGICSCSSVKKSFSSIESKTELQVLEKKDSAGVKKSDSSGTTKEGFDYYRETVEEDYDSIVRVPRDKRIYVDSAPIIKRDTTFYRIPVKKTTTKEWGKYTKEQTTDKKTVDTSGKKEEKKTNLNEEKKEKVKLKEKSGFDWWKIIPWLAIISLLIALFIVGRWAYKKFL